MPYFLPLVQGDHCQPSGKDVVINSSQKCPRSLESNAVRQQMIGEGDCPIRDEGELVRLSDIRLAFRFPRDSTYQVWNWRIVARLYLDIRVLEKEIWWTDPVYRRQRVSDIRQVAAKDSRVSDPEQDILLHASLDYAPTELLESDHRSDKAEETECIPPSPWLSMARVDPPVERTLSCQLSLAGSSHPNITDTVPEGKY